MTSIRQTGEALFSQHHGQIESTVRAVAAHHRLSADERQELHGLVMLKVVQDDFSVLRRFQGKSTWGTYLRVIVQRVLLDQRIKKWGRWRPCARARQLGTKAVLLDRLINRDGLEPQEAIRRLSTRGVGESAGELERLAERIPRRPRRRFVPCDTHLETVAGRERADRRLEAAERRRIVARLKAALASAFQDLPEFDRRLLGMRPRLDCAPHRRQPGSGGASPLSPLRAHPAPAAPSSGARGPALARRHRGPRCPGRRAGARSAVGR